MYEYTSLDELEKEELELLWRRLKGEPPIMVCRAMGIAEATYFRYLKIAYYKLGIDRENLLKRKMKWLVLEREFGETIKALTVEEVKSWKPKRTSPPIPENEIASNPDEHDDELVDKPRKWYVLTAITLLAVFFVGWYAIFRPKNTPLVISSPTLTEQPSTAATEAQVPILLAVSDTSTIVANTPTIIVTEETTATLMLTPTETLTVEPSIVSSLTPSEIVLFEENFDSGLLDSNVWEVVTGEPYVYSGVLTTDSDEASLMFGDPTWENYRVTFDILDGLLCWGDNNNPFVGVRVKAGNFLAFTYSKCVIGWNEVEDYIHDGIQLTYEYYGDHPFRKISVSVQDNTFQALDYDPYITDKYPSGKVIIKFRFWMKIDNVKVVQLP